MEPLAPHQKLFVDRRALNEDAYHADIPCNECHGGNPEDPDWLTAHQGVVRDPSFPPAKNVCAACHEEQAEHYATSLHVSLKPFEKMALQRSARTPEQQQRVEQGRRAHCTSCHSSCGQCHISRPSSVGGGLLDGHRFLATPPTRNVCTACHGSRVEHEYYGKNKGVPPDVHMVKRMRCVACHTGEEMHGDGQDHADRYAVTNGPQCVHCHENIYAENAPQREQHLTHKNKLSCQVCHAMPYKNCYNCHFGRDEHGYKYFINEKSVMNFKIGRNPQPTDKRPELYVTVRHVPVDQASYRYYGVEQLGNFNTLPTWKMATPHTINRRTPQNARCEACHGNALLFLRKEDVPNAYQEANKHVLVNDVPPLPEPKAHEGGAS